MNEYGITKDNLMASLPEVLAEDSNMAALAAAVAEALVSGIDEIDSVAIYTRINDLPSELLDILAQDFKVDWWDTGYDAEEKRQLLSDSWRVHRILGTKSAVEIAVQDVFGGGVVTEWFEYGGEPHHFKISGIDPNRIMSGYNDFMAFLGKVKRQSAVLDHITSCSESKNKLLVGFAIRVGRKERKQSEAVDFSGVVLETDNLGACLLDESGGVLLDEVSTWQ